MNIKGLVSQFKNENELRYGREKKKDKNYSAPDVDQFKLDMLAGATIKEAAKKNNIPAGSAYRYVPEETKRVKNKKLAIELATKKITGEITLSYRSISELCGYGRTAVRVMTNKIKEELCLS